MRPNVETFTLYNVQFTRMRAVHASIHAYANKLHINFKLHILSRARTHSHIHEHSLTHSLSTHNVRFIRFFFLRLCSLRNKCFAMGLCTMNKRVQFHRHTYKCISAIVHNAIAMYVGCTYKTCIARNLQMYTNALLRLLQCNRPAWLWETQRMRERERESAKLNAKKTSSVRVNKR